MIEYSILSMEKECSICGILFESKAWNAKYCYNCKIIKEREWKRNTYYNNREEILEKQSEYYNNNKKKINKKRKKKYNDNKKEINKKQREYYNKNKKKILLNCKKYRERNKIEYLKRNREYNKRPEVKARRNEKRNKRRKDDHLYRLIHNLTCGIRDYMRLNDISKTTKSYEYIGCSPEYLKKHLEKQFKLGMTWDNYGTYWHVDHIIPISSAKTEKDIYKLNHYLNLQPLEAEVNLSKGAKIPEQLPIYIF